jgi:hypothetical protein
MNKVLLCGLLLAGVGCVHIKPVGPLAQFQGLNPDGSQPAPETPDPIVREAPRPTLPAVYITPSEVTAANADEALKRLAQELETDRRSMDAMPRYAEVSVVK